MKNNLLTLFTALCLVAMLAACGGGNEKKNTGNKGSAANKPALKPAPTFNADSAYAFIEAQVAIGPRVPNTATHNQARQYLVNTLERLGATVQEQSFVGQHFSGPLQLTNIIGSFYPEKRKRILLAAHWDTRPIADKETDEALMNKPIDGANDGGSGVGVLLEVARTLQAAGTAPEVGVDIIFFDGEDWGPAEGSPESETADGSRYWCLGSQHWSANKHQTNYTAYYGILLDMVGAKGATFYREGVSMNYAPTVVRKVWGIAGALGHGQYFVQQDVGPILDDHVYVNRVAKLNMIDIVDHEPGSNGFFADYHHTQADNMEVIDKQVLFAVGNTVMHVLYNE